MDTGQPLHDLTHPAGTHPAHEHVADGFIQLGLTPLVAFKQLASKPAPRTGHRDILNLAHARHQVTRVAPIALIATLVTALIAARSDEGFDFFFQDRGQDVVNRVPEFGL